MIPLRPNRIWRTYPGGRTLDTLAKKEPPDDSHFPEDWIASTTMAVNPGREHIQEGISQVVVDGKEVNFASLIKSNPDYYLGPVHYSKYGPSMMVLVKFLDSAVRLHFQCHPTAEFARKFLHSPSGKTEAYHILGARSDNPNPYIYLGFQKPPSFEILKKWIIEQNIPAIENCFEKIPVKSGDTFIIPGGLPHAIGEGVFMVEIMEPSDLAVRIEFEKSGYVLPESARFMDRDINFAMTVFDFSPVSIAQVEQKYQCQPRVIQNYTENSWQIELIGSDQTSCFSVRKSFFNENISKEEDSFYIGIVTEGSCQITSTKGSFSFSHCDRFFCPFGEKSISIVPTPKVEILECYPPD